MSVLEAQFKIRLVNSIEQCKDQKYDKLYEVLLKGTRLPKSVLTNAAASINANANSIESFFAK